MEHFQSVQSFQAILQEGALGFGIELDAQAMARLTRYFLELRLWNAKTNLTGLTDDRDIAIKLFVDSFGCLQAFRDTMQGTVLDIGSGAGFPGIPIKIVEQAFHVDLLEPRQKKVAFLRSIVGTLGLEGIAVNPIRIQDLRGMPASHQRYSHAITRAVEIHQILPSISPLLLQKRGKLILCRSTPFAENVDGYGFILTNELSYELPFGGGKRVLSVLELAAPS